MDPQFRTSFIPKKPIVASSSRTMHTIGLFSLLSTVLFVVSIALSAGAFFYQKYVTQQIVADKASLARASGAFEPDTINQLVRLNTRIETSKQLLTSHIAVTPLFDYISGITLQTVRFTNFSFSYLAPDKIVVLMNGQATGYAAVALESDLLNAQKPFSNTIVSNMALQPQGTVSFDVSTVINPNLLSYSKLISGSPIMPTLPAAAPTVQPAPLPAPAFVSPSASTTQSATGSTTKSKISSQ